MNRKRTLAARMIALGLIVAGVFSACASNNGAGTSSSNNEAQETAPDQEVRSEDSNSGTQAEPSGDVVHAVAVGPVGALIWDQLEKGWEDSCAEYGWESQYIGPGISNWSDLEAVTMAEQAITQNPDVIALLVTDFTVAHDVLKEAKDKGIITVLLQWEYDEETMADAVDIAIAIDPVNIARKQCEAMDEMLNGEEAVLVYLRSQFTNQAQNDCWDYIQEYFAEKGNVTVQDQYETLADTMRAQNLIADIRKVDPVNAVIMCDGAGTIGVASYIEENGLSDEIYMVGIDYEQESLQSTKDGYIDRLAIQDWYNCGYLGGNLAGKMLAGEDVPKTSDAGSDILTQATVDEFAAKLGLTLN